MGISGSGGASREYIERGSFLRAADSTKSTGLTQQPGGYTPSDPQSSCQATKLLFQVILTQRPGGYTPILSQICHCLWQKCLKKIWDSLQRLAGGLFLNPPLWSTQHSVSTVWSNIPIWLQCSDQIIQFELIPKWTPGLPTSVGWWVWSLNIWIWLYTTLISIFLDIWMHIKGCCPYPSWRTLMIILLNIATEFT